MRFVVDDAPWAAADVDRDALEDSMDALAEQIDAAIARGEGVGFYVGIWDMAVVGGDTVVSLLFEPDNPRKLAKDIRRRLARQFDKLSSRAFDEACLNALDVVVCGETHLSPAGVYAWQSVHERKALACITPKTSGRGGSLPVRVGSDTEEVHFVTDDASHVAFFREAIRLENADEGEFERLAPSAFPNLCFVEGVWRGLGDLSRPYRDRRADLTDHLAVLSDHGARIFALEKHARIEAEFMSLKITISPETKETLADGTCRRARQREYRGESLVFEWHTKIELHQDRIHVHPGTDASGGRVIVGIIHRHLPLPGD